MESLLVVTILLSLGTAFFCSLSEAALLSVPLPHVKHLAERGSRAGRILEDFKGDISRPITAILILNTVASTTGPAFGGAIVESLFGERGILIFAICMSMAVLFLGELIPKLIGVNFSKSAAPILAVPLALLVRVLSPLVYLSNCITSRIETDQNAPRISHEEVLSMAALGTEEGALDHLEGSVISNVIDLDKVLVRVIVTPRVMVFRVKETLTLGEVADEIADWNFTRVPTFREEDPDHLTGYVRQRDIYRQIMLGKNSIELKEITRPLHTIPELMRADKLLLYLLERREHICGVVDEHGALAGVITLEDILEEIVGREIVDEYDVVR